MASNDYFGSNISSRSNKSPLASAVSGREGTPGTPHTPVFGRSVSSQFGSPGSYRIEEEAVVYEVGSRFLRAGFAGESAPRCIFRFGPHNNERVGDLSRWTRANDEPVTSSRRDASRHWQLWSLDVRNSDLGLMEDQLERALREIYNTYFLLDLKPRKAHLVVSPNASNPVVEVILRVLFRGQHQPTSTVLMSSAVLNTVAAGLRCGLVIDIGWHETTVTAVYEYREILQRLSDRAGRSLHAETANILKEALGKEQTSSHDGISLDVTFEAAEDAMNRLCWCRKSAENPSDSHDGANDTVQWIGPSGVAAAIPFSQFAVPAEKVFFDTDEVAIQTDDNHLPIALLVWKCLLALPNDVRAVCVSRIIITGGGGAIPGLKARLMREIEALVQAWKWDPVMSYGSAKRGRLRQRQQGLRAGLFGSSETLNPLETRESDRPTQTNEMEDKPISQPLTDEITEKLARSAARGSHAPTMAEVRGVHTLGAWAGASLLASLKVEGTIEVKREEFLKHGIGSFGSLA